MSKNTPVNRRKPRPEASKPGMFTGRNPNFVAKALAAPFNTIGNLALLPKNIKEKNDPENMGNNRHFYNWTGRKTINVGDSEIKITPRPSHHYFDLLDGGKKTAHFIDLNHKIDLRNITPEKGADAAARIAAKSENDGRIHEASGFIGKDPLAVRPPSKYQEPNKAKYYSPYK